MFADIDDIFEEPDHETFQGLQITPIKSKRKRKKMKKITKNELIRKNSPLYSKNEERENCTFTPKINPDFILERITQLQEEHAEAKLDRLNRKQIMDTHYSPYRRTSPRRRKGSIYSRTPERSVDDLQDWLDKKIVRPFQKKLKKLGKNNYLKFQGFDMDVELPSSKFNMDKERKMWNEREMEILGYGTDKSGSINASLSSNAFKGFYKPIGRLNQANAAESKKRARTLILSKINQAIRKKTWLKRQWTKINHSPWKKRKIERIEMLVKLEKEIKEQKRIEIAEKNELKKLIVGKDDPK